MLGLGFGTRTQVPESQNIPIKLQFNSGSKGPTSHVFALRNELEQLIFTLMCTDLQYGPETAPVQFNDIEMFYNNILQLFDEIPFDTIKRNIDFRDHVIRVADTFERVSTNIKTVIAFSYRHSY